VKPVVVLDSNAVAGGIGWKGDSRRVLTLLARRGFVSVRSQWLTDEWADATERVAKEARSWETPNWAGWLDWLARVSILIDDPPIRKTVRDPKDDPVLMAAVAARASFLVTYDRDLLDLEKPFGVQILPPGRFLVAALKFHG
jgi:putative PIN family toxin of toxin-antitoxin system